MTDDTPMTDEQRAEAYEAEAAHLLDKVTHRGYWSGDTSPEADKFVELIVQAAVLRVSSLTAMARASQPARCPEMWQPAAGGDIGQCTLSAGHEGWHQMTSRLPHTGSDGV